MNDHDVGESRRLIARHHAAHGRRYLKAGALIFLAMLAGFAIGVGSTVLYLKDKMHRVPPSPDAIEDAMVGRMQTLLGISPDEEEKLRDFIDSHMEKFEDIRSDSFESIRSVFREMDQEFLDILGPDRHRLWAEEREKRFHRKKRPRDRDDASGTTGADETAAAVADPDPVRDLIHHHDSPHPRSRARGFLLIRFGPDRGRNKTVHADPKRRDGARIGKICPDAIVQVLTSRPFSPPTPPMRSGPESVRDRHGTFSR
ncbi:MAG: hypothetical protein LIP18_01420 [Planctomycetes bacterium]|nr:hypothetical protein [Planctomycetota bacterium]